MRGKPARLQLYCSIVIGLLIVFTAILIRDRLGSKRDAYNHRHAQTELELKLLCQYATASRRELGRKLETDNLVRELRIAESDKWGFPNADFAAGRVFDGWGRPIWLRVDGESCNLISSGPNGVYESGSGDDISFSCNRSDTTATTKDSS